jgi:hypothetical protein
VIRTIPAKYSVTSVRRMAAMTAVGTKRICPSRWSMSAYGSKADNICSL